MLIDPNANHLQQWQQKQRILDQLHEIANLPITADPQQRKELQQHFFDFIYQQNFDSLSGGLLVKTEEFYYKPIITNLYLSEILIAADQVFYQGDFLFVGRLILNNIVNRLSITEKFIVEHEEYCKKNQLSCFFKQNIIDDLLDKKERQLLFALIPKTLAIDGCLITYNRSLRDASERINMHYKEAQMIEFSLLNKLKDSRPIDTFVKSERIENIFELNCELIISLTNCLMIKDNAKTSCLLKILFQDLLKLLKNELRNRNNLTNLIYSGIILLQYNFDSELICQIEDLLIQLVKYPVSEIGSEKVAMQEATINLFIKSLSKRGIISGVEVFNPTSNLFADKLELLFLSRELVDLNTQLVELRSKFNPYRLVYTL